MGLGLTIFLWNAVRLWAQAVVTQCSKMVGRACVVRWVSDRWIPHDACSTHLQVLAEKSSTHSFSQKSLIVKTRARENNLRSQSYDNGG